MEKTTTTIILHSPVTAKCHFWVTFLVIMTYISIYDHSNIKQSWEKMQWTCDEVDENKTSDLMGIFPPNHTATENIKMVNISMWNISVNSGKQIW